MTDLRSRYLRHITSGITRSFEPYEIEFLIAETNSDREFVISQLSEFGINAA